MNHSVNHSARVRVVIDRIVAGPQINISIGSLDFFLHFQSWGFSRPGRFSGPELGVGLPVCRFRLDGGISRAKSFRRTDWIIQWAMVASPAVTDFPDWPTRRFLLGIG